MKRPWTLAEIQQLRALAEKGKLTVEISDTLSRSYESVKSAAFRHGITLPSKPEPQTTIRLVRLYLSEKGIWHYDIERNGIVKWSSLGTRDEGEARRKYESLQERLMEYARAK
jgi:hypothetical protein